MLSRLWKLLGWTASHRFWGGALALVLVVLVAAADAYAGRQIAFSFFYVGPILLATWAGGRHTGMLFAALAVVAYIGTDALTHSGPASWITVWNFAVRGATLVTVALLASTLRTSLEKERERARIDDTTGIPNARTFRERLDLECARKARKNRPLTLLYMDLDGFKQVNDTFGHSAGDQVLQVVGGILRDTTRTVDMVGRLGGDEFGILLPDTDEAGAEAFVRRLCSIVAVNGEQHGRVSFSLGVATFHQSSLGADEALAAADRLMYAAKAQGPNRVERRSFSQIPQASNSSSSPPEGGRDAAVVEASRT
jgi:diguanylate cyclase (GGDEF)-like protein